MVEKAKQCIDCYNLEKSSSIPSKADLETLMKSVNWVFTQAGRHYGVSDNAVRKWCKKLEIVKPIDVNVLKMPTKNELTDYLKSVDWNVNATSRNYNVARDTVRS